MDNLRPMDDSDRTGSGSSNNTLLKKGISKYGIIIAAVVLVIIALAIIL